MAIIDRPVPAGVLLPFALFFTGAGAVAQSRIQDVVVLNNTAMVLEELQLVPQVGGQVVVGRLAEPLSSGKTATVKIEGGRCGFVLSGRYEDGSPVSARRNLCKHRQVRMVDLR